MPAKPIIPYLSAGDLSDTPISILTEEGAQHVLVSYAFCKGRALIPRIARQLCRFHLMIDSGAFSVKTVGEEITLKSYCDWLEFSLPELPKDTIYIVLDDLEDPETTLRNQREMEKAGFSPIPVFHYGEDAKYLDYYAENYPLVALGGMAIGNMPTPSLRRFWEWVVQRHPNTKFHILGSASLEAFTLHQPYSLDCSSWIVASAYRRLIVLRDGRFSHIELGERAGFTCFFTWEDFARHNVRALLTLCKMEWVQDNQEEGIQGYLL